MSSFKSILRFFITTKGIILLLVLILFVMLYDMCSWLPDYHSKQELIENYEKHKAEIDDLKSYFRSIIPRNTKVEIEFTNNKELERFGIYRTSKDKSNINTLTTFLDWHVQINSARTDSIITTLGWTRETIKTIKQKLDNANCIQVESGEPTIVGFQRSGMAMLFYNIFDTPISEKDKPKYNDSCTYIYYKPTVVLQYSGGAIGSQCFPKD
jgi:hypothetical protein